MKCAECGGEVKCIETRDHPDGRRRQYRCLEEGHKFTTMERPAVFSLGRGSRWQWADAPTKTYADGILDSIARLQELADYAAFETGKNERNRPR